VNGPDSDKIALYESMLQADPNNTLIKLNLYDLYHRAGEFEKAADGFASCLEDPEHGATARSNLGKVRLSQQDFPAAESLFQELIDAGDRDAALFHNLGISLYCQHRWEDAESAFATARDGGLSLGDNLRYLAFALHHQKKTEDAKGAVQQWLDLGPSDDAAGYLAVLELDLGDREAAQQAADLAL
jgi:tetratricopeptide (TPR) repeat protein